MYRLPLCCASSPAVPVACAERVAGTAQGVDNAKLELQEVVDFLKNPDKYTALGAKIPKVRRPVFFNKMFYAGLGTDLLTLTLVSGQVLDLPVAGHLCMLGGLPSVQMGTCPLPCMLPAPQLRSLTGVSRKCRAACWLGPQVPARRCWVRPALRECEGMTLCKLPCSAYT